MKKFATMAISVALIGTMIAGGSLAYLQDSDSDVNVMTLGNVDITQHEYQRAVDVDHNAGEQGEGNGVTEGALVPFEQGQALYPAVPKNNVSTDYSAEATDLFYWGDYVYSGTAGNGLWNDANLSNVMDKFVFVKNTGKSDAYFRTIIAFECPEGMTYGVQPYTQGNELMMNVNAASYDWEEIGYITVEGTRYWVEEATYKNILNPGNQAHPSLLQVVLTHNATNEDMELLGDTYEILVLSQAVQTQGFADAQTALDTAFGKASEKAAEWFGGMNIPTGYMVSNSDELEAAIEAGETKIWLNPGTYQLPNVAKGKTLTIGGTEDAIIKHENQGEDGMNYSLEGSTVVFNGVTIETTSGTYRGFARSTAIEYNECNFVGPYTLGAGSHTFNDCHFNLQNNYVWTWGGTNVVFDGCTFEDENGVGKAILVHNTVNTEVTVKDCNFVATTGAKTWDGIDVAAVSIDPNGANTAKVTFEGTNNVSSAFNGNWQIKYAEDTALVTVVE